MSLDSFEITLTIAAAASSSNAFEITDVHQMAIWVPAGWTAAGIAIQFSRVAAPAVAADWWTVGDGVGEVAIPAVANRVTCVPASIILPRARWMRLISGTSGAPIVQAAQRLVTVTGRRY
jgi:hypothetical protein